MMGKNKIFKMLQQEMTTTVQQTAPNSNHTSMVDEISTH